MLVCWGSNEVTMTRLYCAVALPVAVAVGCQKAVVPVTSEDTAELWQQDDETDDAGELPAGSDSDSDDADDSDDKPDDAADGDDKPDDEGDTGTKPSGECGPDFDSEKPCEGTWEETMCTDDDGMLWWCEDGTWNNTEDKP